MPTAMKRTVAAVIVGVFTLLVIADLALAYLNPGVAPGGGDFGKLRAIDSSRSVYVSVNQAGRQLGLQPGDVRDFRQWSPEQRIHVAYYGLTTAGTSFELPFERGGRTVYAHVVFAPQAGRSWSDAIEMAMRLLLLCSGVLLIWRGKDAASLYAGLFVCGVSASLGYSNGLAGPARLVVAVEFLRFPAAVCAFVGRFLFGWFLLPQRVPRWLRAALVLLFAAFALPFFANYIAGLSGALFGVRPPYVFPTAYMLIELGLHVSPLVLFAVAAGYARGQVASAVRMIFVLLAISWLGPVINDVALVLGYSMPWNGQLQLTYLVLAVGMPYAVLSKRLVAVDFVVSKAIVYAIVLSVIVGIFIIAERAIEIATLGRAQSAVLELLVPLVLGFSIRWIERWTEHVVERVLYRDKLRAEQELSALAEDFPQARNVGALSKRVASEVHRYMHAPFVCVYREASTTYTPIATAGQGESLPIDADDPAFMRMRSKRQPIRTDDLTTALPISGVAVPLVVFGNVIGAIYCHYRETGEHFDPDEMQVLCKLAHELAIALLWVERDARMVESPIAH